MSDVLFDTVLSELNSFSYDQCVTLLSRLSQVFKMKRQESMAISLWQWGKHTPPCHSWPNPVYWLHHRGVSVAFHAL